MKALKHIETLSLAIGTGTLFIAFTYVILQFVAHWVSWVVWSALAVFVIASATRYGSVRK